MLFIYSIPSIYSFPHYSANRAVPINLKKSYKLYLPNSNYANKEECAAWPLELLSVIESFLVVEKEKN